MVSDDAVALPVDYYGWNGYSGNSTIYMTTGLTDSGHPYVLTTAYGAASQTRSQSPHGDAANAVNVSAGQAQSTTDTQWMFNEYYVGGGSNNYLLVNIPIVAGGASERVYVEGFCDPPPPNGDGVCYPPVTAKVGFQTLSVSPSGAPPDLTTQINTVSDSGLNASQSNMPSNDKLAKFGYQTLCTFVPYLGYACWPLDTYMLFNNLTTAYESHPGSSGNSPAYEKFQMSGGGWDRNVFTTQTLVTVKIPRSAFMSYLPVLNVSATNLVANWVGGGLNWVEPGATAWVLVSAVPAVTLTGTVKSGGSTLANQEVMISTSSANYHVTTNSDGKYRFFAQPNTLYTISSTQSTPFGPMTFSQSSTTPNDATSMTVDIPLASSISGTVKNSAGAGLPGVSVDLTNPANVHYVTTTDSQGNFRVLVNALGTYGLTATACGYGSQSQSAGVSAFGTAYRVDFLFTSGTATIGPIHVDFGGASAGALVTIRDCAGTTVYSATTDSSGNVPGKSGLAYNIYTIQATATDMSDCPDGNAWLIVGSVTLALPPSQSPTVPITNVYRQSCPQ